MANNVRKYGKKILSLLLVLTMCLSMVQIVAAAPGGNKWNNPWNPGGWGWDWDDDDDEVIISKPEGKVDFKVYLLYSNQIPNNIQQSFAYDLFGPSGDNKPYTTVTVDIDGLLAEEGVEVEKKNNGHWYISYQTCDGLSVEELWALTLKHMDADGQAFFSSYFKNNYIGYVVKVESDGGHIDGIYEVNPAYLTEIYIENSLETTLFDDVAQDFDADVLSWFAGYADIDWDDDYRYGEFDYNGSRFSITMEDKSAFRNGKLVFTEKTTNFYVSALYYVLEDITPELPPEPNYYTLTVNYVDEDGVPVAESDVTPGLEEGSSYTTQAKQVEGYDEGVWNGTSDAVSGTMDSDKTVVYVYSVKELPPPPPPVPNYYTLTVHYLDESGDPVADRDLTQGLEEGTPYATEAKVVDGYELIGLKAGSDAVSGTMDSDKVVIYVYAVKELPPPEPPAEPDDYAPVVEIVKTTDKASYKVGERITWTVTVTNISQYPAYNVNVVDEMIGLNEIIQVLSPGASESFSDSSEAEEVGNVVNVANVTWEDGDEIPDIDEPDEPKDDETVITVPVEDPEDPPVNPPVNPPVDPPYNPPVNPPYYPPVPTGGDGLVDIPDEDVPLAAVPQTGDISTLLLALSTFSGSGLALIGLNRKKEEE